jgi:3-methyladenine DNA glycosylase AlkD
MSIDSILKKLTELKNPNRITAMERAGIVTHSALGISVAQLRILAREIGCNHPVAMQLWCSGVHEARLLAILIANPTSVDNELMESWIGDAYSWDLCDGCCMHLFRKVPFAYEKIEEWRHRPDEFVKRAAFVLMATLAVHEKKQPNSTFEAMLPLIIDASNDERNFVKKAVNWALRQIGKRNQYLNARAIQTANALVFMKSKSARWIGMDALRELQSEKIQSRVSDIR